MTNMFMSFDKSARLNSTHLSGENIRVEYFEIAGYLTRDFNSWDILKYFSQWH